MKILTPDKYDIKIERIEGDKYKAIYKELFLEDRENLKEATDYTIKILENNPFISKVERIAEKRYLGIKIIIESSLNAISDFMVGEFLGTSRVGDATINQIFILFSTLNKKK